MKNLFVLNAKCERSDLAVEMNGGQRFLHMKFPPMTFAECESKLMGCLSEMENPDDWKFMIDPVDNEGCVAI